MLLLAVVVYVLQTRTVSLCLAADLARTAAGLFIMLARQPDELGNSDSFDSFKTFSKNNPL